MNNFSEKTNFIWPIADLLRSSYKPHEYADVILPLVVLRRLDIATEPICDKVRSAYEQYKDRLDNPDGLLRGVADSPIYNTSPYNWRRLLDAPVDLSQNLVAYLNGFSTDMQDIIEKFDFRRQISRLQASDRLYPVMKQFATIDLHQERCISRSAAGSRQHGSISYGHTHAGSRTDLMPAACPEPRLPTGPPALSFGP